MMQATCQPATRGEHVLDESSIECPLQTCDKQIVEVELVRNQERIENVLVRRPLGITPLFSCSAFSISGLRTALQVVDGEHLPHQ